MRKIKREVIISIKDLCVDVPIQFIDGIACRQILFNSLFDPGIGAMVVDPSDSSFFRVR